LFIWLERGHGNANPLQERVTPPHPNPLSEGERGQLLSLFGGRIEVGGMKGEKL